MRDLEGRISAYDRIPSLSAGLQSSRFDGSGIARRVRTVVIIPAPEKQEV